MIANGNQAGAVSYGADINAKPGDLLTSPTRTSLNPNFGAINYAQNDRVSNYNGVTFDFRGRAKRAFFDASYTRSNSKDDAGTGGASLGNGSYPTQLNPHQFYGNSPWDVPNRLSFTFNYEVPGLNGGHGATGLLTGGWGLSGTTIYQSGYPLTVVTTAPFLGICTDGSLSNQAPGCSAANPVVAFQPGSGDYNADADNLDYPNVTSYHETMSRSAYMAGVFGPAPGQNGVFTAGQFTMPTLATNGNEKAQQFRQPSFAETDLTAYKDTRLTERWSLQLRFEFFNLFNHPNLFLDPNLANGSFGRAISQQLPRNWQVGAKVTF